MAELSIKLPDIGEGVAAAEVVEWLVTVGQVVREDDTLVAVMTDKATVEIPSPAAGIVMALGAELGQSLAIGAELVRLRVESDGAAPEPAVKVPEKMVAPPLPPVKPPSEPSRTAPPVSAGSSRGAPRAEGEKPLAPPSVRKRAMDAGIDLRRVTGTGPAGRITHSDLDAVFGATPPRAQGQTTHPVIGLRRKIAERMEAAARVPHISYVEEVDVTELEALRAKLNAKPGKPRLTLLPFIARALAVALKEHPALNAHYDEAAQAVTRFAALHLGIAAQVPGGLVVPVVRDAGSRDLWSTATEISRLAEAARAGTASREELSGSTITLTSLGAIGGIVSTPILNRPEVAIVGVNRMVTRPMWDGTAFQPRKVMNLSSSFDHRIIDGWEAAQFIQSVKALLETPALLFLES